MKKENEIDSAALVKINDIKVKNRTVIIHIIVWATLLILSIVLKFVFPCFCFYEKVKSVVNFVYEVLLAGFASYLVFFVSFMIPESIKRKSIKKYVWFLTNSISKSLQELMSALLRDKKWLEKTDDELKKAIFQLGDNHCINTAHSTWTSKGDFNALELNSRYLDICSSSFESLEKNISKVIEIGAYCDIRYLQLIDELEKSKSFITISICKEASKLDPQKIVKNTFVYDTFTDMPIWVFNIATDGHLNFILLAREIIGYNILEKGRRNNDRK